ncbi:MAG: hypothetical protein HQK81_04610 [Desulfovibrionaceae bacterium]|nr:hypothetical protein [Desulfovibrionaceae bacterium]MBF0513327.1 hypothetical protein [Desulfovibrionaceae bacterium]
MPIAAIAANPAAPVAQPGENPYHAPAPARATDVVSVSAEAKNLAAPAQDTVIDPASQGDIASVHDFDPERIQRLLKLLE